MSTWAGSTCWSRTVLFHRTDFIRTAIRNQLDRHGEAAKRSVARKSLELGLRHYTRADLEAAQAARPACCTSRCWALPASPPMSRPTRPRRHRLDRGAGRAPRQPGGQGRPRRPHGLIAGGRAAAGPNHLSPIGTGPVSSRR